LITRQFDLHYILLYFRF